MENQQKIENHFMVQDVNKSLTKDNRPFLKMILTDADGKRIQGIMFDSNKLGFEVDRGDVLLVDATMQFYNGSNQLKINNMYQTDIEKNSYTPSSQYDPQEMLDELQEIFRTQITTPYLSQLLELITSDDKIMNKFKNCPAAKTVHHAYRHGLLEHTLSVVRVTVLLGDYYKDFLNKELLIIGGFLHDFCKIYELEDNVGFDYTNEGKLVGHISLGYQMVEDFANRVDGFPNDVLRLIQHSILSHHGRLEFGSPVVPKTAEAIALGYIDDLDSKLQAIQKTFLDESVEIGGWTSYSKIHEKQFFNHGFRTSD